MRGLLLASAVLLIADGRGWQAAAAQTVAAERRPATPRTVWGDPDLHGLWNVARDDGDAVDLEFAATTDESNLEDQLALLSEQVAGSPAEEEVSLRLLRHYASSVRHQQFHDTDVVTVRVGPPASL